MQEQVRHERIARNEARFRSINEHLQRGLGEVRQEPDELSGFVCECADMKCDKFVHVPLAKYEEVRADPMLFVVKPGHEAPGAEDVIENAGRYAVVQKRESTRHVAEATDPRSS